MTDTETHANTVREGLGVREWAASITPSRYGEQVEREMPEAFASLDWLVARITELDQRANFADAVTYRKRAEAAEARIAELTKALQEIAAKESWVQASPLIAIARAALAAPEDTRPVEENLAARIQEAKRILDTGDIEQAVAWLTEDTRDE